MALGPLSHPSFYMKDIPYLQLHSFHRLHPTSRILGVRDTFSSCIASDSLVQAGSIPLNILLKTIYIGLL